MKCTSVQMDENFSAATENAIFSSFLLQFNGIGKENYIAMRRQCINSSGKAS